MADNTSNRPGALIIGGTSGIGRAVAQALAVRGDRVIIAGRDAERAATIANGIGMDVTGIAVDLGKPETIAESLAGVGTIKHLVISAIDRDANTIRDYDIRRALNLVTLKLVGYAETIHTLIPRFTNDASIVLLGGLAKDRPYPGSTTVSTVNGGIVGMTHTLAKELGPVRVNGVHPGIIRDTETWSGKPAEFLEALMERTPAGRLVATADVVGAITFLLDNKGVNGVDLVVDGGWLLT